MKLPRKRLKVTIELDAHDWDEACNQLQQLELDFHMGNMRGGGYSTSGYGVRVDEDETAPEKGEYLRQLQEWAKAKRAERREAE